MEKQNIITSTMTIIIDSIGTSTRFSKEKLNSIASRIYESLGYYNTKKLIDFFKETNSFEVTVEESADVYHALFLLYKNLKKKQVKRIMKNLIILSDDK